ncbi:MAG: outer membrane lipoprotein carrier protein LolA [Salinibacter sp.]
MNRCSILCVFLILMALPATAQPSLTLDDVRTAYRALDGLQANFTQVVGSEFADDSTRIEGSVTLAGDQYRVETPGQVVVTNGSTTWIYTPADSQVIVDDADTEDGPITPETFLEGSADDYEVTERERDAEDDASYVVLSLSATSEEARFQRASLWVRRSDRVVTRLRAVDRDGATFTLNLQDIQKNPSITDTTFSFDPPANTEVVDLRTGD